MGDGRSREGFVGGDGVVEGMTVAPVALGDVVVADVCGTGVPVVATAPIAAA